MSIQNRNALFSTFLGHLPTNMMRFEVILWEGLCIHQMLSSVVMKLGKVELLFRTGIFCLGRSAVIRAQILNWIVWITCHRDWKFWQLFSAGIAVANFGLFIKDSWEAIKWPFNHLLKSTKTLTITRQDNPERTSWYQNISIWVRNESKSLKY